MGRSDIVSISKAAQMLGVCIDTLREWDKAGTLKPIKTIGKHRRYRLSDLKQMQNNTSEIQMFNELKVAASNVVDSFSRASSEKWKECRWDNFVEAGGIEPLKELLRKINE